MSNDKKDNLLENKNLEKKLDIALKNRNFEIGLFWQRSNYFLVLNSAIAIAFFSFLENDNNSKVILILMGVLAGFGLITSYLWLKVLFGGKFWQNYWEAKLKKLEEGLEPIPNTILFNNNKEHNHEVVDEFIKNANNKKGRFKKYVNKQILKKPSVSKTMMRLSISFMVLWLILLLYTFIHFVYTLIYTPSFFLPMGYSVIFF